MRVACARRDARADPRPGALDRFAPLAPEERLAVDVDLELDREVERALVARLARAGPDLRVERVLVPAIDDVRVEARRTAGSASLAVSSSVSAE